eukprot:3790684-Pleurochrysis_carterae.AAC.2
MTNSRGRASHLELCARRAELVISDLAREDDAQMHVRKTQPPTPDGPFEHTQTRVESSERGKSARDEGKERG